MFATKMDSEESKYPLKAVSNATVDGKICFLVNDNALYIYIYIALSSIFRMCRNKGKKGSYDNGLTVAYITQNRSGVFRLPQVCLLLESLRLSDVKQVRLPWRRRMSIMGCLWIRTLLLTTPHSSVTAPRPSPNCWVMSHGSAHR